MTEREFLAARICDGALRYLKDYGRERFVSGRPVLLGQVGGIDLLNSSLLVEGVREHIIDVWVGSKKVFSFRWDEAGNRRIINFFRGDWEATLIAFSGPHLVDSA
jgi:hypothetical protein